MTDSIQRIPSGIPGLDDLISGGFVNGTINMVTGKTGTAKSTFCAQFINEGAAQQQEGTLYITSEETRLSILRQVNQFGWDFASLEQQELLQILEVPPFEVKSVIGKISEALESMQVNRLVIDSVSMFEVSLEDRHSIRKFLFTLFQRLRELGVVALITSEIPERSEGLSPYGAEEFMVDAIIKLQYQELADIQRNLVVRKMRMTDHSPNIHPFEIGSTGIQLKQI